MRGSFLIRNAFSVHLSQLTFIGSTQVAIEVDLTQDSVIIEHISTFGSYCNDIRIDQGCESINQILRAMLTEDAVQNVIISNSSFASSPITGCPTFHSLYITGSSNYIKSIDNTWSNKVRRLIHLISFSQVFPGGLYIGSTIFLANVRSTNVLIDQCTMTSILQKDQQNLIDFATNNTITQINVRGLTIHNCAGGNQANIFNVAQSNANSIVLQDLRVENASYVTLASFGTTTVSAITFDGWVTFMIGTDVCDRWHVSNSPIFEVLKIDVQVNSPFVSFDNCLFVSSSFHAIVNNMGGSAILGELFSFEPSLHPLTHLSSLLHAQRYLRFSLSVQRNRSDHKRSVGPFSTEQSGRGEMKTRYRKEADFLRCRSRVAHGEIIQA